MALTVVVRSGDAKTPPKVTFDAPRVVIGRGEGCEIRLPDPSVSHRHASIRQRGTEYIVLDEGSTNGTFVGPVRLSPQAPRVLKSGDLIRVGRIWLEIRMEQVLPTQNAAAATSEIALGLVAEALAAQGSPATVTVRVTDGPDAGRQLSLSESGKGHVLGRAQNADLVLTDDDASRRHFELTRRGSQLWVRDLGSKNGTSIDGVKLEGTKERVWPAGKPLEAGKNRFSYEDPVREALDDLERAVDERMADDDSVEPPNTQVSDAPPPSVGQAVASQRGAGPVVERPKAPVRAAPTPRAGWTTTDLAVALLAIGVLALSLLGLFWLFGGE